MKQTIADEQQAQKNLIFTYQAIHLCVIAVALLVGFNGHEFLMLLIFTGQFVFHFLYWPPMYERMQERLRLIAFKQQLHNIYVFSKSEGTNDNSVRYAFDYALQTLQSAGNTHGVRVHMAIFQDVVVFTGYIDAAGRIRVEKTWRETGSAVETWQQYTEFCAKFIAEDKEKRLRALRSDNAGASWVDEHIFEQQFNRNEK